MDLLEEITESEVTCGPVSVDNIPQDLVRFSQWVCWKSEDREGKATKVPVNIHTGRYASVGQPLTWASFHAAWNYYEGNRNNGIAGLGFVFSQDDPFVGVDLDDCLDPETGDIREAAKGVIRELNSYTELSPSGRGVHILIKGNLPPGRRRTGKIELYDSGRFFTVTGNHLAGTPGTIENRQSELDALHKRLFRLTVVRPDIPAQKDVGAPGLPDEELIAKAFAAKNGDKFRRLWQGESSGYPSPSEADLALCVFLSNRCGNDLGRIDRLFRKSGLFRQKWDARRGRQTYGAITIAKAIAQRSSGCQTNNLGSTNSEDRVDNEPRTRSEVIREMNKKHAVIMVGGKCYVMNEIIDPISHRPDISLSPFIDFKNWYGNKSIEVPNETGGTTLAPVSKIWLQSKERRTYKGIVFSPGNELPGFYNLYRGLAIKPVESDWSLMRNHIREVIAGGNETISNYLMAWMANLVQNPGGERSGTSIVMRGKQGVGKGAFTSQFGQIFGSHFLHITNPAHIVNRFNQHLKDALLVFIDEGFWAGDKAAEGILKAMVTEKYFMCEPKGKDAFPVENHIHLIIASNNSWVVPAGFEERRFMVLDVSDQYMGNTQYFKALFEQMDNGGREAMLYELLRYDYSAVNLRAIPRTKALCDQIMHTASSIKKFWYGCLYEGILLDNEWSNQVITQRLYEAYIEFTKQINPNPYRLDVRQFSKDLRDMCTGIEKARPIINGVRTYVLHIPSLDACRRAFEQLVGMTADELEWLNDAVETQVVCDNDMFARWSMEFDTSLVEEMEPVL